MIPGGSSLEGFNRASRVADLHSSELHQEPLQRCVVQTREAVCYGGKLLLWMRTNNQKGVISVGCGRSAIRCSRLEFEHPPGGDIIRGRQ